MSGTTTFAETRRDDDVEPEPDLLRPAAPVPRLGEELPIFCERCGYSLHGLPQCRCGACTLLHFICPECNHRQPINTLRPALQRMLGRVRAAFLVAVVFFKLNWFGWLLFAWFAMGVEWAYTYNYSNRVVNVNGRVVSGPQSWTHVPRPIDYESILAFAMFALPFGFVSRMLLLRWRRGLLVGAVLAAMVAGVAGAGGFFRGHIDLRDRAGPLSMDFFILLLLGGSTTMLGALLAWPTWTALVRAFLPTRAANALLEWQRSLSATRSADRNATRGLDGSNPA